MNSTPKALPGQVVHGASLQLEAVYEQLALGLIPEDGGPYDAHYARSVAAFAASGWPVEGTLQGWVEARVARMLEAPDDEEAWEEAVMEAMRDVRRLRRLVDKATPPESE